MTCLVPIQDPITQLTKLGIGKESLLGIPFLRFRILIFYVCLPVSVHHGPTILVEFLE